MDPIFKEVLESVPQRVKGEVDRSFDIAKRIADILDEKGWSRTELGRRTGKSPSEVSKWLSGTQNFTLRTIAMIEEALGVELIQIKGCRSLVQGSMTVSSSDPVSIKVDDVKYLMPG